jgi:hypothetical protein
MAQATYLAWHIDYNINKPARCYKTNMLLRKKILNNSALYMVRQAHHDIAGCIVLEGENAFAPQAQTPSLPPENNLTDCHPELAEG